ncbi:MAG: tetratricopeptide repeat protein [Anaerolineae bacterium]|nr:tetratricopeptide repeat protein [Anaerolineae bacterium]
MPAPLTDETYTLFRNLLLTHTGLDFPPQRRTDLNAWLWRAIEMIQDALRYQTATNGSIAPVSLEALYDLLIAGSPLHWEMVIDAVTVGETHFFRNIAQFEVLRDHVFGPLLIARREAHDPRLNIWSAGCASGEEPYSIAMLLYEMVPDLHEWQLTLTGTDINRRLIEQAQQGVYRDWSFREEYALYAQKAYFAAEKNRYILKDVIRRMVDFEVRSLLDCCRERPDRALRYDVIFCRNVVLYFGGQMRRWIFQRMYEMLQPGGWLFVGHADPPPPHFAAFEVYNFRATTVYRRPLETPRPAPRPAPHSQARRGTAPLPAPEPPVRAEKSVTTESSPDAEFHYRLGRWHADRQNWDEALYHCQRAITLTPTYETVYYTLALIHQSMGEKEEAIAALRRAIYLRRDWLLPRFTLAGLYRESGQEDHARRELRNVIKLADTLRPDALADGADGMTVARLKEAALRQLDGTPAQ